MKRLHFIIGILSVALFFSSCSPDCQIETIQKPEWSSYNMGYSIDTTINYTVLENKVEVIKSRSSKSRDYITHTVTVFNNNKQYAGNFSVKFSLDCGGYLYNSSLDGSQVIKSARISPQSKYTFTTNWNGYYDNLNSVWFNSKSQILQKPEKITLTRRIDKLVLKDTVVNNCESDIDALKAEYNAKINMYNKMKEAKLIKEN